jgi:hypothetical protein
MGLSTETLAVVFFWVNVFSGLSYLGVGPLARRVGLLNTMVFTHLPSRILLILVPLAPSPELAITFFLLRMCLSQMDVPTRKSYTMAVVDEDERTATAGITNTVRTAAAACDRHGVYSRCAGCAIFRVRGHQDRVRRANLLHVQRCAAAGRGEQELYRAKLERQAQAAAR